MAKKIHPTNTPPSALSAHHLREDSRDDSLLQSELRLADLWFEKCGLDEARQVYEKVFLSAEAQGHSTLMMQALAGELRMAGEALNFKEISKIEVRLDRIMAEHPDSIPSQVWYCKGIIAHYHDNFRLSQIYLHRYLKELRLRQDQPEDAEWRAWVGIANSLRGQGKFKTARILAEKVAREVELKGYRGIRSAVYMLIGNVCEMQGELIPATAWHQKSHGAALEEHNWYHYIYVLLSYARICRLQKNERQANSYLDLVEKVASTSSFGVVRRLLKKERDLLDKNSIDLLIDGRKAMVKTREKQNISLKKQYILLDILEALTEAHQSTDDESKRGLSKSEIIEKVWGESYRPEIHDNKLYYNINRLRKLIESDTRNPEYLVSWKEGYQIGPGIRVELRK